MSEVAREAGFKRRCSDIRIAARKECQVRCVAAAQPSGAERRRKAMPPQAEPPVSRCPLTPTPIGKGMSNIPKDALDGCKARYSCAGADRDLDGLQSSEPGLIADHDGRGKGGNGARPADDRVIAPPSRIVQSGD